MYGGVRGAEGQLAFPSTRLEVETINMYKGHRIRVGDQHLVYHFVLGWLITLFIIWMSIFYFQELRQFDISKVSLSTIEIVWSMKELLCLLGSLALSGSMMLLYIHFFKDRWQSLWHRQKLARMILENHCMK